MIIATFNVNSVRTRLPILERWINEIRPDLLFMQETKTQDEFFPEDVFDSLGYVSCYHGEKAYNGVAVLVNRELNDFEVRFGFDYRVFDTRVLTFRYDNLVILNTYVPQGKSITHPDFIVKKNFFAQVREVIERECIDGKLFLWLGDLNVAPTEIDVNHPEQKKNHVCFCDEIRGVFADTSKGLVDVLRKLNPAPNVYTFYDYRVKDAVNKNIGWRIDLMLASENLADLAVKCCPDTRLRTWDRPSDHVPLIAEFRI